MSDAVVDQGPVAARRSSSTYSRGSTLVVAVWVVIGLAAPGLFDLGSLGLQILFTASACVITSAAALFTYARTRGIKPTDLWLTVPGLFWLVSLFGLGLASLAWINPNTESFRGVSQTDIARALQYALVWLWMTVVGFWWTTRRLRFRTPIKRFDGLTERFKGSGTIAYIVGLFSIAFLVSAQRFSYISGPEAALSATSSIPQIAASTAFGITIGSIVVLWNGLTNGSRRLITAGLVMFAIAAIIGLIGGMKEPIIASLFGLAATYRVGRGQLPKGSIVGGVILVLLVFAFVNPYRTNVRIQNLSVSESLVVTARYVTSDANGGLAARAGDSIASMSSRARSIDSLGLIIARTPSEIPYRDLAGIPPRVAATFVPRSLWPDKPITTDGYDFAIEYAGQSPTVYSSFAVTLVGDAYRYGGLLSIIGFGLLLGAYLAVLDRLLDPLRCPAALIMMMALAIDLAQSEKPIAPTIGGQLRTAVVVGVIMVFVIRREAPDKKLRPSYRIPE